MDRLPVKNTLYIKVKDIKEAKLVIMVLTQRDLKDDRITDNMMGLEEFDNGEWGEYYNEDGQDIDEIMKGKQ